MYDQKNDHSNDVDDLSASDDSEPEEWPSRAPFDPELDHEDDDNDKGEVETSALAAQPSFSLRGGSSAFSDRRHSIFDCLDSISPQTSSSTNQDHVTDGKFVRPEPPHPRRKTSQPPPTSPPPQKKRGVPDYLVHPERWTRYSLEDVPETSDGDNSRIAHQFLSSLQHEIQSDPTCAIQQRMIFCKPNRLLKEQAADQLSAVRGKERGMHLSHLEEEEDDKDERCREREKVGVRRTDHSEEETEERPREGEKDMRRAVGQPELDTLKPLQKEKGEEEEKEANPGFTSFRKTKSKNYRKSSEQEDN
uniref:U5 small nuclear ribonucleoprotein TSSC4 n=1 Tax=Monopterus albus TaxID=43700 RepID=UPI0009B4B893|nr:protein TSSC4 [Monopterus albus]